MGEHFYGDDVVCLNHGCSVTSAGRIYLFFFLGIVVFFLFNLYVADFD